MTDTTVQIIIHCILVFNLICIWVLLGETKKTITTHALLTLTIVSTLIIAYGLYTQNPAVAIYHT